MSNDRRAFLQAICEQPDDDTPRLVFADWLEERGDRDRAEFIRLDIRLATLAPTDPEDAARAGRRRELVVAHGPRWLSELPRIEGVSWPPRTGRAFERGFPCFARIEGALPPERVADVFASTPLTRLHLALRRPARLRALVDSPSLRGVRELDVRDCDEWGDVALLALGNSPHLMGLTALRAIPGARLSDRVARVVAESLAFAALEVLVLYGHDFGWDGVEILAGSPNLARLRSVASRGIVMSCAVMIGDEGIAALANARTIRLKRLRVNSHQVELKGVEILATAPAFAGLRELNLAQNPFCDRCAAALAASPTLSPECVVNVRQSYGRPLTARGLDLLRSRFHHVLHEGKEPDLGDVE